jgi:hypothetical protein
VELLKAGGKLALRMVLRLMFRLGSELSLQRSVGVLGVQDDELGIDGT